MRKSVISLMIIIGGALLIGVRSLLWAQTPPPITPPISVTATFDKDYFDSGEKMGVRVTVANTTGRYLWVNKGFSSKLFYLEMRLIDPAGRLLLPKCDQPPPRAEFPDAPPLPFVACGENGIPTRVAPYEVLPPGWSVTQPPLGQPTKDLRDCYQIKLSGHYSAEVQLSVMIFKQSDVAPTGDPCDGDIKKYESIGVFKSESKTLYTQGSIEVDIIPQYWFIAWKDGRYLIDDIAVTIWPEEGKVADDYSLDNIQLNNVVAKHAFKMYSFLRNKEYVLALFDKQKAINSLGQQIQVGQWYPVVISGTLKNTQYFSGGHKVEIISLKDYKP
jgi:hypothetical protein